MDWYGKSTIYSDLLAKAKFYMKLYSNLSKLVHVLIVAYSVSLSAQLSAESVFANEPLWINEALKINNRSSSLLLNHQNRVMFDEDIGWSLSRENTDKIIKNVAEAGFNVYVPCVWHGAGTYFFSDKAYLHPRLKDRKLRNDDPLEYLIKKAHENHIEVHPWFTVVRRDDSVYKEFYDEGTPNEAFNIHNEKFIEFITLLMKDVVNRYDIDGINLDNIRSMGHCTTQSCSLDYKQKTSRDLGTDLLLEKIPKSRIKSIEDWNGAQVDKIVKNISQYSRKTKPKVIVSVDSVPDARHLRMQGQDSLKWLNLNWIDIIFYMDYSVETDVNRIDSIRKLTSKPDAIVPLLSLFEGDTLEKKSGALLNRTVLAQQHLWPNTGIAFYHYRQMSYDQIQSLKSGVYQKPACPSWRTCEPAQ